MHVRGSEHAMYGERFNPPGHNPAQDGRSRTVQVIWLGQRFSRIAAADMIGATPRDRCTPMPDFHLILMRGLLAALLLLPLSATLQAQSAPPSGAASGYYPLPLPDEHLVGHPLTTVASAKTIPWC